MVARLLTIIFALFLTSAAWAQPVSQSGKITPGHPVGWTTNGVVQDGGSATDPKLNNVGVLNSGLGICDQSLPTTSNYTRLCLGYVSGVPTISVSGPSGANTLNIDLNGTIIPIGSVVACGADASACLVTATGTSTTKTLAQWTGYLAGTVAGAVLNAPAITGGSIGGAIAGTPTLSGLWTFSGGLSGTLTGHSSLDLALAGGTMSGALHMGSQTIDGSGIAFTGGTVDGVAIGGTTRAAGAFTTLGANGTATLAGGGAFSGTFSGAHTYSNAITFSGSGNGLLVNNTGVFGSGGTQTLSINGNSINTGGSSTAFVQFKLAQSATQTLIIKGNDGAGSAADIITINGTTTSNTVVHNSLQLAGSVPTNYDLYALKTITGTAASAYAPLNFSYTDNMNSPAGSEIMSIQQFQTTTAAIGARDTFTAGFHLNGTSGNVSSNGNYVAGTFACTMSANDNGVSGGNWGIGATTTGGSCFAQNNTTHLFPGATWVSGADGWENDIEIEAGASVNVKTGMNITLLGGDAVQGAWEDDGLFFGSSTNQASGLGWRNGIAFGRPQSTFPIDPLGIMIGAGPVGQGTMLAGIGLDFPLVTFSTAFIRSRQFLVDGSGVARFGSGAIAYTGSGMSLDVNYAHGLAEGTVISGGSIISGGTSGALLKQVYADAYNGLYTLTGASGGVGTAFTVTRQSYAPVGTSATVTLTPYAYGGASGTIQITQTWTTDSVLSLQPSGGSLKIAGTTAVSCSAGTVTLLSLVVTSGIVTHC